MKVKFETEVFEGWENWEADRQRDGNIKEKSIRLGVLSECVVKERNVIKGEKEEIEGIEWNSKILIPGTDPYQSSGKTIYIYI